MIIDIALLVDFCLFIPAFLIARYILVLYWLEGEKKRYQQNKWIYRIVITVILIVIKIVETALFSEIGFLENVLVKVAIVLYAALRLTVIVFSIVLTLKWRRNETLPNIFGGASRSPFSDLEEL